jgi:Pyridine nucleotide-disulphide oxidoreductase
MGGKVSVDQVLRATTIGDEDRVYFLGPFARRIDFSAQQNRALNLVHALRESSRLDPSKPVAVVGGGLAGLTIAAALTALRFEIYLFERQSVVLARQRNTLHRIIHPTLHAWPEHETLDPTTQVPFFDWCTDQCKPIMVGIANDWERIAQKLIAERRLRVATKVIDYSVQRSGITLETAPQNGGTIFGTVIFATGFKDERIVKSITSRSYWEQDNLENYRDNHPKARFMVSGTGDGGLIDCLRLVHRNFDEGVLAVRAATTLFKSSVANEVRIAEEAFRKNPGEKSEVRLADTYESLVSSLPEALTKTLEQSRIKITPLVWLVGRRATPFGRDAAPIYKLLIAHAKQNGSIRYVQGKVSAGQKGRVVIRAQRREEAPRITPQFVVIRHGAANALNDLLKGKPKLLGRLRQMQSALSDDMTAPIWASGAIPVPDGFPAHDPTSRQFQDDRFPRLKPIERIWPHMRLAQAPNHFVIETPVEYKNEWLPKSLFGVKVVWSETFARTPGR